LKLSTEDGTNGDKGRITVPLERELQRAGAADVMVYACGPEPMLEAVAHVAEKYGKPSQVSVERVMGCGMGGCYSCVIPVKDAGGGQHYVRSCIGGPVFKGAELVWD
jgi:dihydroorotate dehydrogenase electron transfer subunit